MQPGDKLDGYTILRRLGAGGYGEVWLCRSDALGDLRALKFIAAASPDSLEKEFKALASYRNAASKLRSPNLMPIEHVGRTAEGLHYVMPLADGSGSDPTDPNWHPLTLATLIEERCSAASWFSCREIADWMRPVLEALQTLSDAGFVHRDVKPDNILIFGGQPTLADISLLDEDKATLSRRGTPGFLTPSWYVGGNPDMYGAAATLYTLLTGNPPDRMGRSAFTGPPQGESSLSPEERARRKHFHAVIRRATDERSGERYRDYAAMAEALTGMPPKSSPRKRVFSGALLAGGILLPVVAVVALTGTHGLPGLTITQAPEAPGRMADNSPEQGTSSPKVSMKDTPFVNSLGMKFVPVPGTEVLFCIHETRWKDYAVYANANPGIALNWRDQTFDGLHLTERPEEHPVVNVNWDEANAFCKWLSQVEKRTYRLPTDHEWSAAAGLHEAWKPTDTPETVKKDPTQFPWGRTWPPPVGSGNYSDQSRKTKVRSPRPGAGYVEGYDDDFPTTAPVMRFAPNQFGLFDLGGNVKEWTQDNWNAEGTERVLRDHAWHQVPKASLASSIRLHIKPDHRDSCFGFRIVLAPSKN